MVSYPLQSQDKKNLDWHHRRLDVIKRHAPLVHISPQDRIVSAGQDNFHFGQYAIDEVATVESFAIVSSPTLGSPFLPIIVFGDRYAEARRRGCGSGRDVERSTASKITSELQISCLWRSK